MTENPASTFNPANAAETIWAAWTGGGSLAALDPAPADLDQAYAAQHELERFAGRAVGYKIAATSPEGQRNVGVDEPFVGRLYADSLRESGCSVAVDSLHLKIIEPEIAFEIGEDLPPDRASAPRALAAVKKAYVGIEIPDSRFADHVALGAPSMIADNGCSGLYALGPEIQGWPDVHLDRAAVTVSINGSEVARGLGGNALGDPSVAFLWLVRHLSSHGRGLKAGEIISTGTATDPVPVKAGDVATVSCGELGSATVTFT